MNKKKVVAPTGNREPSEDTKQLLALQTDAQVCFN